MPLTTTSTMPPAIQASFDQAILSTPTRNFIYNICAERRRMPKNGGDTIRFKGQSNKRDNTDAPQELSHAERGVISLGKQIVKQLAHWLPVP